MLWSLVTRIPVTLDITRDRNILYREATNGKLENVYKLRIMNQHDKAHNFVITLEGLAGASLDRDEKETFVDSGEIIDTLVRVQISEEEVKARSTNITLRVTATDNDKLTDDEDARFIAPADWFQ